MIGDPLWGRRKTGLQGATGPLTAAGQHPAHSSYLRRSSVTGVRCQLSWRIRSPRLLHPRLARQLKHRHRRRASSLTLTHSILRRLSIGNRTGEASRFHAIATPHVSSRPTASHSVPHREPPLAVPHQAKRRKRPAFSLIFAVLAMAPPARIELATLALEKPRSVQLSYGAGRNFPKSNLGGGCCESAGCSSHLSMFQCHE